MVQPSPPLIWFVGTVNYPTVVSAHIKFPQHAHAVENLLPFLRPGARVLDVGSGSGYLCAVLHYLVTDLDSGVSGTVVGIDHISELVDWSKTNLRRDGLAAALDNGHIKMIAGDGRQGQEGRCAD